MMFAEVTDAESWCLSTFTIVCFRIILARFCLGKNIIPGIPRQDPEALMESFQVPELSLSTEIYEIVQSWRKIQNHINENTNMKMSVRADENLSMRKPR